MALLPLVPSGDGNGLLRGLEWLLCSQCSGSSKQTHLAAKGVYLPEIALIKTAYGWAFQTDVGVHPVAGLSNGLTHLEEEVLYAFLGESSVHVLYLFDTVSRRTHGLHHDSVRCHNEAPFIYVAWSVPKNDCGRGHTVEGSVV